MTLEELTQTLRMAAVNENTITAMTNAYNLGVEAGQQRKPLNNQNPLLVFAKECVLGAYSETELADAAFRAIEAAHNIKDAA